MNLINRMTICLLVTLITMAHLQCKNKSNKVTGLLKEQEASLQDHIGEKFHLDKIIDSTGKEIKPDFSQSEITIIDFWFNTCPPCIYEMQQFGKLLKGKDKKVSIISISINRFTLWKTILAEHKGSFSFLSASLPNWKHYALKSAQDERLKNDLPRDNSQALIEKFNVTFYPAYFVVNKEGIILSRPPSAVEFLKNME